MKLKAFFIALASTLSIAAWANDSEIVFEPAVTELHVKAGEEFTVPFNLKNSVSLLTFQWWMDAPAGIEVAYDEAAQGYAVDFGERLTSKYTVTADYNVENHKFLILGLNSSGKKMMPAGEGLFCTVGYRVADDMAPGEYLINVTEAGFNWHDGQNPQSVFPQDTAIKVVVEGTTIDFTADDEEITVAKGSTFDLKLNLTNKVSPLTFQFWVKAPKGIDVLYDTTADSYAVDFGDRLTTNYQLTTAYKVDDSHEFLVLGFNKKNKKLMPTGEGTFCTISMVADVAPGEYDIVIDDVNFNWIVGTNDISTDTPEPITVKLIVKGPSTMPGDANGDYKVDATDIACIIDHMLGNTPATFFETNADIDGDSYANATDIAHLIDIILAK